MKNVTVIVPGALRQFTDGAARLSVEVADDATVDAVLRRLATQRPTLHRRIQDEAGALRRHVNVFVGETNVRDAQHLDTGLTDGVEVTVLPAVSGG